MGSRILTVCFGGEWKKEDDIWVFMSKTSSKAFVIDMDISLERMKSKIVERFHVDLSRNDIMLSHLHPKHQDIEPFRVDGDDDLQVFFEINEMPDVAWSLSLCVVVEGKVGGSTTYVGTQSSVVENVIAKAVHAAGHKRKASEVNGVDNFGSQEINIDDSVEDTNIAPAHDDLNPCVDAFFGVAYVDDSIHACSHVAMAEDEECDPVDIQEEDNDVQEKGAEVEEEEVVHDCDGLDILETNVASVPSDESRVGKGQIFGCKEDVHEAVSLLAVRENFEFKVKKSTKSLWVVGCTDVSCEWRLRAVRLENSDYFEIRTYTQTHSCTVEHRNAHHRQATYQLIGRRIRER